MSERRAAAQRASRRAARPAEQLASAHDGATDRLWAEIATGCQQRPDPRGRVAVELAAALRLLEPEPALARVLLLEAHSAVSLQLASRHRLLLDHLAALLHAARFGDGAACEPERQAIEQAFDRAARQVRDHGAGAWAALSPQLLDVVLASEGAAELGGWRDELAAPKRPRRIGDAKRPRLRQGG